MLNDVWDDVMDGKVMCGGYSDVWYDVCERAWWAVMKVRIYHNAQSHSDINRPYRLSNKQNTLPGLVTTTGMIVESLPIHTCLKFVRIAIPSTT